jgi:hypothetical protein
MSDTATKTAIDTKRPKQGRSPAYPGLSLKDAVAKADVLYRREGKYAAPMPSAFAAWGFSLKSSGGREARAALKYFGLITVDGDNETGKVKLTEDALRVLLDEREDQTEKHAILRRLALTPPIHAKLFQKFPDGIKSDASAAHDLVFEEGYNKSAAAELVAEFKETADYAGLFQPGKVPVKDGALTESVAIGDRVRVEIDGVVQLASARVREIAEDQGAKWFFVEGSDTGLSTEQVTLVQKDSLDQKPPLTPPVLPEARRAEMQSGWREEQLLDESGEAILIRYKGEPSVARYEFIRDYFEFKVARMTKGAEKKAS